MIIGKVDDDGVPLITLDIAGQAWRTIVDSGFNGGVELPMELKSKLPAFWIQLSKSTLAAGQVVEEDVYALEMEFDGRPVWVEATFAPVREVLIGTGLMREHCLTINYKDEWLTLVRV